MIIIDMNGILIFAIFILSAVVHEFMHGYVAYLLGDSTAKDMGRLTLNPLAHIDTIGTILLPLLLVVTGSPIVVGWAKPVPYNPYNLTDQRYGNTKVAFAGPLSNLAIAIVFSMFLRFDIVGTSLAPLFSYIVLINLALMVFNLIPVPPLDGSKLIMDLYPRAAMALHRLSIIGVLIAFYLAYYIMGPIITFLFKLLVGIPF